MHRVRLTCYLVVWFCAAGNPCQAAGAEIDLTRAKLVCPSNLSRTERKAVDLLVEEVHKRTWIRLPVSNSWPAVSVPVIAVGPSASLGMFTGPFVQKLAAEKGVLEAEGYRIHTEKGQSSAPA